jgi:hypothetical protein
MKRSISCFQNAYLRLRRERNRRYGTRHR